MARYIVTVMEHVRSEYVIEADSAEEARQLWDDEGEEAGTLDWSLTKMSQVERVTLAE